VRAAVFLCRIALPEHATRSVHAHQVLHVMSGVEDDDRTGTTVADAWTLERVVGHGATALVYAARHTSGRVGAMKVLRRSLAGHAETIARFRREAGVAATVCHPNVVSVWGLAETDDGVPLVAMELLEGETLAERLHKSALPLVDVRALGLQLLDAVAACHSVGVIHRDLKPDNVFVTTDGTVKLLDFGVARPANSGVTARRLAIGTPEFMAPEAARGECSDRRVDVFCVGALLRSLITGRLPRQAVSGERTLRTAAREALSPLELAAPDVPRALSRVIDRACAWEPGNRWQSAETFHEALALVSEHELMGADGEPSIRYDDRQTYPATPSAIMASEGRPTLPEVIGR
jgi:eukaryotic-like serine/threonine-protein kinase